MTTNARFSAVLNQKDGHPSRRRLLAGVMAGMGAAVVSRAGDAGVQEATPGPGAPTDLLFMQACEAGAAELVAGEDGVYRLSLEHDAGQTLYFSDRPERIADIVPTAGFIEEMATTAGDPPNAALGFQTSNDDEQLHVAVVELTEPVYAVDSGTITYRARVIDQTVEGGVTTEDAARPVDALPASFGRSALFIDGIFRINQHDGRQAIIHFWNKT